MTRVPSGTSDGRPAVFLDRDGTLIEERYYLADPDGVVLVPGSTGALRLLADRGWPIVVVTNQSGIARGLYTEAQFDAVQRRFEEELRAAGVELAGAYHCPHHPDFSGPCDCRKPGTGMYRRAARDLGLDLARSAYVGDKISDVAPALELGGLGILVQTGYGREQANRLPAGLLIAEDLSEATRIILDAPVGQAGTRDAR